MVPSSGRVLAIGALVTIALLPSGRAALADELDVLAPQARDSTAEPAAAPVRNDVSPGAHAQPPVSEAPREDRRAVIEEIVVTAQKRAESLQEVPISMSVLDGEFMKQMNVTDFRDASRYIPNVSIDTSAGIPDVRMRGFGTISTNLAFEQAVGLVIDGVPYTKLSYWQGPLFDLERIEVLRGPQGTLFGKNTTAGLFNVITKKPTDEYEGFLHGELGELDRRRLEAAIGGPVIPNLLSFRIAALSDERDGLLENTTARFVPMANERMASRDRKAIRAQLGFPDLFGAELFVGYEKVDIEILGTGWELRSVKDTHVPFFRSYDPDADIEPGNFVGSIDLHDYDSRKMDTFVANAHYDLASWGLDAVAGHSVLETNGAGDNDLGPAPIIWIDPRKETDPQTTFELRASSPSFAGFLGLDRVFGLSLGDTDVTVGTYLERREIQDSRLSATINTPILAQFVATDATGVVPPCPGCDGDSGYEESTIYYEETNDSIAGFSHLRWRFADRWTLEQGMRFIGEWKDNTIERAFTRGTGAIWRGVLMQEEFTASQEQSETAFTPKVTMKFDWTDEINFFAGWGKGFRAGGFNSQVSNSDGDFEYGREDTSSWELGSKMKLLGGAATLNVGLFRQDVTDMQVFTVNPDFTFVTENAGKARAQGVEVDAIWLPSGWLTLRGAFAFNDTEFLDFPFGTCPFDSANTDGDEDARCDLTGQPFIRSPKWTGTVMGHVRVPVVSIAGAWMPAFLGGMDLVGGLSVQYKDVHFTLDSLDPRSRQPSFFRLNADVGFGDQERGWSLRLVGENLTDQFSVVETRDLALVGGSFAHVPEPPRLVFGEFRWEF